MPKLKEELQMAVRQMANFEKLKNQIAMTVTSEGLRIELLETSSGTFFESGQTGLNGDGKEVLVALAQELGKLPNHVSIEGHTDATPYAGNRDYGNWELSTDRANSARRILQASGLRSDQISQVRGYADQKLRVPGNPLEPSNRRISLIVQYIVKDDDEAPVSTSDAKPEAKAESSPDAKPDAKVEGNHESQH
jgi:chemotaxis protein MotB